MTFNRSIMLFTRNGEMSSNISDITDVPLQTKPQPISQSYPSGPTSWTKLLQERVNHVLIRVPCTRPQGVTVSGQSLLPLCVATLLPTSGGSSSLVCWTFISLVDYLVFRQTTSK
ncbi:hypothetical protein J6590_026977 [Homalodisca vitripennis]|nr:hypothetical protein J6590_026977 [Homalodisca vitripennis]